MIEEILAIGLIVSVIGIGYVSYVAIKAFKEALKLSIEAGKAKDLFELKSFEIPVEEAKEPEEMPEELVSDETWFNKIKKQVDSSEESVNI